MFFICEGVMFGYCWNTSAAAPDTTAVACDVPLPRNNSGVTDPVLALATSTAEPGARRLTTCAPGATRSTRRAVLPVDENDGILSSFIWSVPLVSAAPTAMMFGSLAGIVIDPTFG